MSVAETLWHDLPYREDPTAYFARIADEPWAMWLDSGRPRAEGGRYDIMVARPFITVVAEVNGSLIEQGGRSHRDIRHPLTVLDELLRAYPTQAGPPPFSGGALGYFAYDLARAEDLLPGRDDLSEPLVAVGLYDWALVVDHHRHRAWIAGRGYDPATAQGWTQLVSRFESPPSVLTPQAFSPRGRLRAHTSRADYATAFARIRHYLVEGDCYQVNLAQAFSLAVDGEPWPAYQVLRALNPAPYGAYLNLPAHRVLSSSPECFLQLRDGDVETRPIKGTRRRLTDNEADAAVVAELQASEKDRAENLMIVDLLRNDLGKLCVPGSVQVTALFAVESFATVHHLVSTVRGKLPAGTSAVDLLRACFPGGSITGAPKRRAMEIIEELEPVPRGVYCGSIGYIGFDGAMDTNIAIRTMVHRGGEVVFHAGGGVVFDSVEATEYQECLDKAAAFFKFLGVEPPTWM